MHSLYPTDRTNNHVRCSFIHSLLIGDLVRRLVDGCSMEIVDPGNGWSVASSRPAERSSSSSRMNFPWRWFIHHTDELLPLIPSSQARESKSRMNVGFILFILIADEVWPRLFPAKRGSPCPRETCLRRKFANSCTKIRNPSPFLLQAPDCISRSRTFHALLSKATSPDSRSLGYQRSS